jgi:S1-C subfamily serine protease
VPIRVDSWIDLPSSFSHLQFSKTAYNKPIGSQQPYHPLAHFNLLDKPMIEPPASRSEVWRDRFRRAVARVRKVLPFASGMLAAFLALWLYNLMTPAAKPLTTRDVNKTITQYLATATPPPAYSRGVYQVIRPSLVLIETESLNSVGKSEEALGSGVVINDAGDVLTALHVVTDSRVITLTFADGTQSIGKIINAQPQNDIAVVQATSALTLIVPAVLGNPNAMQIGDEVYAVGNPFGLYGSLSAGVISAFDRSFHPPSATLTLHGLIQIDAAVNPGNSGGPLLNRAGQVIGIVEGIANPTDLGFFIGIGFAVPIDVAGGAAGAPPY